MCGRLVNAVGFRQEDCGFEFGTMKIVYRNDEIRFWLWRTSCTAARSRSVIGINSRRDASKREVMFGAE